jgi:hypothetical protein
MCNFALGIWRPSRRPSALAARESIRACQKRSIATTKLGANITAIPSQKPCRPDNVLNSHRRVAGAYPGTLIDVVCRCIDQHAQLLASRCRGAKRPDPDTWSGKFERHRGEIHLTHHIIHCVEPHPRENCCIAPSMLWANSCRPSACSIKGSPSCSGHQIGAGLP